MSQMRITVTAPEHLLELGFKIGHKNRMAPGDTEFETTEQGHHFIVRGLKNGVSVRHFRGYKA